MPFVLQAFTPGFFIQEISVRSAFKPPYQFNAIDELSPLKVDFWMLCSDPFEEEMFRRRLEVVLEGEPAWVATPEDVLLHKLYWNKLSPSERRLGDAAGIFAVQYGNLDASYLKHWASHLGVLETLEDILNGKVRPKTT